VVGIGEVGRDARKDAWVWARECNIAHNPKKGEATLSFTLPPGSYATVLLEELLNRTLLSSSSRNNF